MFWLSVAKRGAVEMLEMHGPVVAVIKKLEKSAYRVSLCSQWGRPPTLKIGRPIEMSDLSSFREGTKEPAQEQ